MYAATEALAINSGLFAAFAPQLLPRALDEVMQLAERTAESDIDVWTTAVESVINLVDEDNDADDDEDDDHHNNEEQRALTPELLSRVLERLLAMMKEQVPPKMLLKILVCSAKKHTKKNREKDRSRPACFSNFFVLLHSIFFAFSFFFEEKLSESLTFPQELSSSDYYSSRCSR